MVQFTQILTFVFIRKCMYMASQQKKHFNCYILQLSTHIYVLLFAHSVEIEYMSFFMRITFRTT